MAKISSFDDDTNSQEMQEAYLKIVIQLCREQLQRRGITIWEACRQEDVKEGTATAYHNILTGKTTRPEYTTVKDMANVCGVMLSAYPYPK